MFDQPGSGCGGHSCDRRRGGHADCGSPRHVSAPPRALTWRQGYVTKKHSCLRALIALSSSLPALAGCAPSWQHRREQPSDLAPEPPTADHPRDAGRAKARLRPVLRAALACCRGALGAVRDLVLRARCPRSHDTLCLRVCVRAWGRSGHTRARAHGAVRTHTRAPDQAKQRAPR